MSNVRKTHSNNEETLFQNGCFVTYDPQFATAFGSCNAAIILSRLEYWFERMKGPFYKFLEPCDHPLYRKDDSWSEEIGFSKKVFRRAFDKIGVRYRSKTELDAEENPFKGKIFIYYQDRNSKKTIFLINYAALEALYDRVYGQIPTHRQKLFKVLETPPQRKEKGLLQESPKGSPRARAPKDIQITTSFNLEDKKNQKRNKQSEKPSSSQELPEPKISSNYESKSKNDRPPNHQTRTQLLEILRYHLSIVPQSQQMERRLITFFRVHFKEDLEKFEDYVITVSSSKFLMGECDGFRFNLNLGTILTPWFIETVRVKEKYDFGSRETYHNVTAQKRQQREQQRWLETLEKGKLHPEESDRVHAFRLRLARSSPQLYESAFAKVKIIDQPHSGSWPLLVVTAENPWHAENVVRYRFEHLQQFFKNCELRVGAGS